MTVIAIESVNVIGREMEVIVQRGIMSQKRTTPPLGVGPFLAEGPFIEV
jgi:hypothetical protein